MTGKKQYALFFFREKNEIYILPEIQKIPEKKAFMFSWLSFRMLAASITVGNWK